MLKSAKHIVKTIVYTIFLFCMVFSTVAQKPDHFPNIRYITSDEGLSQNEVTSILQDKKGFLWVGTRGGLNKYDGNTIKVYQNELGNSNSLSNNSVETLFEDSNGLIWIGTKSNGVSIYNPKFDRFEQVNSELNELSGLNVTSIEEGVNGTVWLGTRNHGLYIYNRNDNSVKHSLGVRAISDILKTRDNNMWIGTGQEVHRYDDEGIIIDTISLNNTVSSLIEDKQTGIIYFASRGSGLHSYDPKSEISKRIKLFNDELNSIISKRTHYIYLDNERNIWVGTWGDGLYRYNLNSKKHTYFSLHSNLAKGSAELYNDVLAVYQDLSGTMWFGTNGGGLCKVDNNQLFGFNSYNNTKSSLPNEPIWSILKDRKNKLLIGIKGSNNLFLSNDDEIFNQFMIPEVYPNKSRSIKEGIKVIYQDLNGAIWAGGNHSLFKLTENGNSFKVNPLNIEIKIQDSISPSKKFKVTSIFQTTDSIFWVGSQEDGLRRSIGKGDPLNQQFKKLLGRNRISAILEDRSGKIWIGTYNGIQLYQPETNDFKRFHKNLNSYGALSSNIIICLYEDSKGNIWVGTPNGLNKMIINENNLISFQSFQVTDGLPNNYIHSILEDDSANLWISTNKGISKFNISDNTFYNYDVNDGLQSNSFMESAGFKDSNGKLYFGGVYGLNHFHPDSISKKVLPEVVLTEIKISGQGIRPNQKYNERFILNKAIEYTENIDVEHNENILTFEYAALDFSNATNSYKFKMEGLEKDWQTSTSQTNVTYTNLRPGDYFFKVRAVNDSQDDEVEFAGVKITIRPPFWKTWPAFSIYILLFVGLLLLYGYFINQRNNLKNKLQFARIERKKEEELAKMKTQFFTDIAHEFRTPLSLIAGPVESLMGNNLKKEQQYSQLTTIHYHTKRLLHLVSQLLDFRKAESGKMMLQVAKGNFGKFTTEIFISFRELATSKNITYELNIIPTEIPLTYDRIKMEIVLCNLLSNAFKYTDSKIGVTVSLEKNDFSDNSDSENFPEGYCKIIVSDNGKGMPEEMVEKIFDRFYQLANSKSSNLIGTGIGLSLTKNIVELHKGEISVQSNLNEGINFIIKLPLGETHFNKDQFIKDFKKAEDPIHYQVERVLVQKEEIITDQNTANIPTLLIVEDNSEIRAFLKSIFEADYIIIEAENGIIGLEKAKERIPEIIITDLMMPKIDGLTLCNSIRSDEDTLHIPIVMLTARTTNVFKEKGYNSGADIYVTKPFNPNLLQAQVEGLIKSRAKLKEYFSNKINLIGTEIENKSIDQEFINKLMSLVEDNLTDEKLNRDFLASHMAMSSSTLYRKVKGLTGFNITIFIRSIRLKKAAQMILNKEYSISGIAYRVGFNDPKYFRKCFVKQFGVNPSQFKKNTI